MSVRFQKTPQGEVAILPRKDYEALVARAAEADEDAGMARLVARARAEVAAGAVLLPKDVVDRLADGENSLRVLREWRGVTLQDLSRETDIDEDYLTDTEGGRRIASTEMLRMIADALQLPFDLLAPEA